MQVFNSSQREQLQQANNNHLHWEDFLETTKQWQSFPIVCLGCFVFLFGEMPLLWSSFISRKWGKGFSAWHKKKNIFTEIMIFQVSC